MANFARYTEWSDKLDAIRKHFALTVQRYNDAVIVYYTQAEKLAAQNYRRSLGVTRFLANYYKPSSAEQAEIAAATDKGKALSFAAFKHSIDKPTFEARFALVSESRYESFEDTIVGMNELNRADVVPLGPPEFMLGSRNIIAKEEPRESADWVHLTGSIDAIGYNKVTGKLVLVELKSGFTSATSNAKFMSMQTLHLKEKHCKQLCLYARMLTAMAVEIGIVIAPTDLELLIVANNKSKHLLSIWRMVYDPETFLGSTWAGERWVGILDSGMLRTAVAPHFPSCAACGRQADIIKTKSLPIVFLCKPCFNANRCHCGKLARVKTKAGLRLCSRTCPTAIVIQ